MDTNFLTLYIEFFKIGLFAVGGGLATLPFLYDLAARSDRLDASALPSMLAVAQLVPGAIGINLSAYTASLSLAPEAGGVTLAQAARIAARAFSGPLGMITPQIIIILAVARALGAYRQSGFMKAAFAGLRPAACGLLAAAGFLVLRGSLYGGGLERFGGFRPVECALFALILAAIIALKRHPAWYIAAAACAGAALKL